MAATYSERWQKFWKRVNDALYKEYPEMKDDETQEGPSKVSEEPPVYIGGPSYYHTENPTTESTSVVRKAYYTMMMFFESRPQEADTDFTCANWCECLIVMALALGLIFGALFLILFWIMKYHKGFSWDDEELQFNLHPVLMVGGFISSSGFSILIYRICRCGHRALVKCCHIFIHMLSIPCFVTGYIVARRFHNLSDPTIPHFYSLHSWIGLIVIGMFSVQFVFGFIFFIIFSCGNCGANFRDTMAPIHAAFGLSMFVLAIAACLTGLTKRAITILGSDYEEMPPEARIINAIALVLVGAIIIITYICARVSFRKKKPRLVKIEPKYEVKSFAKPTFIDKLY